MNKDINALIYASADLADMAAPRALADALLEAGDLRAEDVRVIAEAKPVVPAVRPGWWVPQEDYAFAYAPFDPQRGEMLTVPPTPDAFRDRLPMASGPWWSIDYTITGVFARVYPGTPQAELYREAYQIEDGVEEYLSPIGLPMFGAEITADDLLRGFETARRQLLLLLVPPTPERKEPTS